jgi:hypothetical protein
MAKNVAQHVFRKKLYITFPWEKVPQKFGLILKYIKKLPIENKRPIGENSPNLVTLLSRAKLPNVSRVNSN